MQAERAERKGSEGGEGQHEGCEGGDAPDGAHPEIATEGLFSGKAEIAEGTTFEASHDESGQCGGQHHAQFRC